MPNALFLQPLVLRKLLVDLALPARVCLEDLLGLWTRNTPTRQTRQGSRVKAMCHVRAGPRSASPHREVVDRLGGLERLELRLEVGEVDLGLLAGVLRELEHGLLALADRRQRRTRVDRRVLEASVRRLEQVDHARGPDHLAVVRPVNRVRILGRRLQLALQVLMLQGKEGQKRDRRGTEEGQKRDRRGTQEDKRDGEEPRGSAQKEKGRDRERYLQILNSTR